MRFWRSLESQPVVVGLAAADCHDYRFLYESGGDHDFFGERRWQNGGHGAHPHESPPTMLLPLVVLALLAAVAGVINLPFVSDTHFLEKWLEPSLLGNEAHLNFAGGTKWVLAGMSIVAGFAGIWLAVSVYLRKSMPAQLIERDFFARAWRYDETISATVAGPGRKGFSVDDI